MESKRDGVGVLFNTYVTSKTRLVDTQDFSSVNAPKKRGRKRKVLTEQEATEKKERRRSQNQKAAQTLRNKRERQMNELKEQVEALTKEKGHLETLVHQLQQEKQTYLVLIKQQQQPSTSSSSPTTKTTPTVNTSQALLLAHTPTKSVNTFESAELVDMPSEVTYTQSQVLVSVMFMWCAIQTAAAAATLSLASLPFSVNNQQPTLCHTLALMCSQKAQPTSKEILSLHWKHLLIFLSTLSCLPPLPLTETPAHTQTWTSLALTQTCGIMNLTSYNRSKNSAFVSDSGSDSLVVC
jgi:chlorite dismutase